ncbi:type IV secretion protein Rhs [Leptolyngbyaceae cyanobacterium CCMR0082]|uniref:Type IV secretion protein Rhs n=2 Tax=Adonisia turfae TaxID=2950184 RepID=A0A6M0SFY4_9CYAN|nr:VgrG-related protein [Adonisia turfae]MDV3348212.1 VgrG-related protein [Leptothoe sp. LEGE 181152]NEZ60403.1 type IV secretion protein Rhs [Adonisia turfae CCMR0081]NEZ67459.1 type IV secretion protein Rhs [Adonisia turfae CCMR0082]
MAATKFVATPTLKIDGKAASSDLMEDLLQIVVEESLHLPGMFTLVIQNDYYAGEENYQVWKHEKLFEIGKSIEIGFTSSTTESDEFDEENKGTVIKGEITAIETHFTSEAQAPIIIRGYDASHRLHRGRHNRSFQNKTDSDIVKSVASEVGISTGTVDSTGGPYGYGDIGGSSGYVFQQNQTNMEFLRERAVRHGFELFVQDGKLNFRKPTKDSTLSLEWLQDIHSFRVRVSSAEQVKSVEVRGWDYSRKEVISETISKAKQVLTDTDSGDGSKTVSSFDGKPKTPTLIMVDQPISQAKEAQTMAQALYDEVGGEFVQADARSEGDPSIRPGRVVKLTGMGNYSGSYYITETRHVLHERIYMTEFSVRGLRGGDLLQTLETKNTLLPGQTLMVGVVADNKDPKGWGRVRVKLPTLTEDHMSNWARVVSMGAGPSRGVDWLPEINDEVLVAFEHGDIHRPYILGGVWNGKDAPPEKTEETIANGKVRLRTLKTRLGHTLQFVEEDKGDSKKGVYLTTVDKHQLHFNDTDKYIDLKTKDGHELKFDDKNKKIELKTKNGHQISMDDNGKKVDIISTGSLNAKSGTSGNSEKININGGEITLTGATKITLKVGGSKIVVSSTGVDISGTQVNIKANATAKMEGSMVDVKGKATVNVQCSGMTKVAGSLLKLN